MIAAGSLSLALALTACGNDAADEETTVEASEEQEQKGGLSDLLSSLGDTTVDLPNYTLTLESVGEEPEMGEVRITATFEVTDAPSAIRETVVMPFVGEMALVFMELAGEDISGYTPEEIGTIVTIYPDGEAPLTSNPMDSEAESEWVRGEGAAAEEVEDFFDIDSLPGLVSSFAELDEIEESGTEEVNGVETTVVEGTLTKEDIDNLDAEQKLAVIELVGSVSEDLNVSLWIDADGFPMRMEFDDSETEISMEFSEIGTTSFEMPAEDTITVV